MIPLSVPYLGGNEQANLAECVRSNFVSSVGPFVDRFEKDFARYVGASHAVACSTGTAALHVALRLIGLQSGDEVLVSDLTFAASANAIAYERGIPVLVDAEEETWNLDPELVVEEVRRRARSGKRLPAAVEVVHILGHPARIGPIREICAEYEIPLIEDAAEALGASYGPGCGELEARQVGTIGAIGCFSFNGNKIMTTGGGGMIVTEDAAAARRAKHLTTQARLPGVEYNHDEIGYNYRLTNVAAALGVAQLEQIERFLEKKAQIADRYEDGLRDLPGITVAPRRAWARPTMWLYSILVDEDEFGCGSRAIIEHLREQAIESRPIWQPLSRMAPFRDAPHVGGDVATRIFSRGLSLPCSVGLSADDQDRVIEVLRSLSSRRRG